MGYKLDGGRGTTGFDSKVSSCVVFFVCFIIHGGRQENDAVK